MKNDVNKNNEQTIVYGCYLDVMKPVLSEDWGRPAGSCFCLHCVSNSFLRKSRSLTTLRCWIISSKDISVIRHMSREPGTGWAALGSNSFPSSWRLNFWSPNHSAFWSPYLRRENNLELNLQNKYEAKAPCLPQQGKKEKLNRAFNSLMLYWLR